MAIVNYPIKTNCFDGKPAKSGYQHPDAMNPCERTLDTFGNFNWKSFETPESYQVWARADLPISMPGIVIFVHGVNSEGEWYDVAEKALCDGLNERLNRDDLKPNKYLSVDEESGQPIRRQLAPENDGRSPVIRFYWGYRAQKGSESKWRIPLKILTSSTTPPTTPLKTRMPKTSGTGAAVLSRTAPTACNSSGMKKVLVVTCWASTCSI